MIRRFSAGLGLLLAVALLAGCTGSIADSRQEPKLSPPIIARPGILRAVVDLQYPPFAAQVGSDTVGLDVDVAAALADQLGLKLELIDGTPAAGAAMVASGTADIVLSEITVEQAVDYQLAFAGTYIADGPAVFAAKATTIPIEQLQNKRVAVQKSSLSYWTLVDEWGEEAFTTYPTLAEAFKALEKGEVDAVVADAIVGSYMLRQYPKLAFKYQYGSASPVGIGVSATKPRLEAEVRAILDQMAAKGVLQTLRRKWVGDMPALTIAGADTSADTSVTPSLDASSSGATSTP